MRQRDTLAPAEREDEDMVVLGAAWLGKTRLIDNVELRGKSCAKG